VARNPTRESYLTTSAEPTSLDTSFTACCSSASVSTESRLGVIQEGAFADLLVLDGNPLEDINVLAEPDNHLQFIMKQGRIYYDRL
jgi:imidazolonepropionase-like amidohydrolase